MKINNKKGFTLVELIVVIAIIGILAAVLIPSITGYIRKARFSNDQQLAGHMTTLVQTYCAENNINTAELTPNEIKTIILSDGQYDLVSKNTLWTFVWNKENKQVEAVYFKDSIEAADEIRYPEEVIKSGYYLIGKGNTVIEQVIDGIRNFKEGDNFDELLNKLDSTDFEKFKSFLKTNFDPQNTLFINENGAFTMATKTVTNVLFGDSIAYIPAFADEINLPSTVQVPSTIEFISEGAFIGVTSSTKLTFSTIPIFESGFLYNQTMLAANGGHQPFSSTEIDYEKKGIKLITLNIGINSSQSEEKLPTKYQNGSFVDLSDIDLEYLMQLNIQDFKTDEGIDSITSADFRVGYTEDFKIHDGKLYTSKFVVKLFSNNKLVGYCSIYYRETDVKLS